MQERQKTKIDYSTEFIPTLVCFPCEFVISCLTKSASNKTYASRPATETVPHGGVRAQAVLRVVAVLGLRAPVGGEGLHQQAPARPHAELAAGNHLPGYSPRVTLY